MAVIGYGLREHLRGKKSYVSVITNSKKYALLWREHKDLPFHYVERRYLEFLALR